MQLRIGMVVFGPEDLGVVAGVGVGEPTDPVGAILGSEFACR